MAHLLNPSRGVELLLAGKPDGPFDPVTMQVIHIKKVEGNNGGGDRYRLVLSDGEKYVQGMLATQINHLITNDQLELNGLVSIQDFMVNRVGEKIIVILLKALVLSDNPGKRLGNPLHHISGSVLGGGGAAASAAAPVQPLYNSTNHNNSSSGGQGANNNNNAYNNNNKPSSAYGNNSGGSPSNPYNRSSPRASSAPIARSNEINSHYTLIKDLNLYQSRWTVQARVVNKSDIRTWNNARGEGSLFNVDLLDQSGYDIRATFFKEAVDKFYNMLTVGSVYTFSGGRLKVANTKYNKCKSPNEITFDQNSEIHLSQDSSSTAQIQVQAFDFVENIAALENVSAKDPNDENKKVTVDVLAYVQSVGEPSQIVSKKNGREFTKLDVALVDDSGAQVTLALWDEQARNVATLAPLHEMVAIRRSGLSDFNGKSLSGAQSIVVAKNNDALRALPAFARLQQWYQETQGQGARNLSGAGGGGRGGYTPLSDRKHISNIQGDNMGHSEKGDYLSFLGTIVFFKKDKEGGAWYPACPNSEDPCRNRCKVTQSATGGAGEQWHCERCNGTFHNCVRKWIFSGVLEDVTGSTWATFFDESGLQLFDGATADDIYQKTEGQGSGDAYESVFLKASYSEWIFKCKVKQETHEDQQRQKTTVMSMSPVNYVADSKDMLAAIAQF